jgi:hypothetical protein
LRSFIESSEQLSLFVQDQLGKEFAILGHKINQRITLRELDDLYGRALTAHTFDGDPVWCLTRKRKRGQQTLRKSELDLLPNELYLRETLLARQDSSDPEPPSIASGLGNVEI